MSSTDRGSTAERPSQALVVFLHGYGADGNDLIDIGRAWQGCCRMPRSCRRTRPSLRPGAGRAAVVSASLPRAQNERWDGVNKAGPGLEHFLDAELARRKLPPSALALVGFSQGTMMALHAGLRRAVPPAAIVGYSGMFVLPDKAKPDAVAGEINRGRRCCSFMATQDDLIPAQACFRARGAGRARRAGRMAPVGRHRPRHRSGGPAPRRRIPGQPIRAAAERSRRAAVP